MPEISEEKFTIIKNKRKQWRSELSQLLNENQESEEILEELDDVEIEDDNQVRTNVME